jgi:hypothetical protein
MIRTSMTSALAQIVYSLFIKVFAHRFTYEGIVFDLGNHTKCGSEETPSTNFNT